jgi:hypothetical protein
MDSSAHNSLTSIQQKLIRTFEHLHNEKQLNEIDSLINFYFESKLDEAITKAEKENNYSAATYEKWLTQIC